MTLCIWLFLCCVIGSAKTILKGSGSGTFSYLITDWIYTYQILKPQVELSFHFTSEAQARADLDNGDVSFVGLDDVHPETERVGLLHFPVVAEALVPQINLPGLGADSIVLERETLARIYSGNISNWRDDAIILKNLDVQAKIPNVPIKVVYRSDVNLLTELWTRSLSTFSPNWKNTFGTFTSWPVQLTSKPTFEGADGNLGVSSKVIDTPNSIGYVSQSYLAKEPQHTQYVQLVNANGRIVPPFPANVNAAMRGLDLGSDLKVDLVNSPNADAWPIASLLFFLISPQTQECGKSRELFKFFFWILGASDLKTIADGFSPLSTEMMLQVQEKLQQVECAGLQVARMEPQNNMDGPSFFVLKIIAAIIFSFCFCLNTYHIYTYRTPLISLVYSAVFLIGSILTLLSPFLWLMVPTTFAICQGRLWLTSMGLCIILGTMFSRTWQLREIYKLTKGTMTALRKNLSLNNSMGKLAMTLSSIFLANLALLTLWTVLDPYTSHLVPTTSLDFEAKWHCYSKNIYVWMGVQCLSIFLSLAWGVGVIYQTWSFHQKSMLRETRWLLLALYNVVLNFAAVLPLLSLGGWDDDKQSLGLVVSLEFSAGGIILANLLPKALSTWRHKHKQQNSKSSVHGKPSTESGLVKLDVSSRSVGSPGTTVPVTPMSIKKPKKQSTKKKIVDEIEAKQANHNVNKDSPTLTGMDILRRPSPINTTDMNSNERAEDSLYGGEISVSARTSEFRGGNNDSLILMDRSERPESPSKRLPFDDPELIARLGGGERDKHPSEPTILEEDEPHSPKESTPFRNFRKLVTSTNHPAHVDPPSPLTSAASSGIQSQVSEKGSANATPLVDSPPMAQRHQASTQDKEEDEDVEVY